MKSSRSSVGLVVAIGSSLPGTVATTGGKAAAGLAVVVASVADDAPADELAATVIAAVVLASAVTGVVLLVLGFAFLVLLAHVDLSAVAAGRDVARWILMKQFYKFMHEIINGTILADL